jgi:hypothetical protein
MGKGPNDVETISAWIAEALEDVNEEGTLAAISLSHFDASRENELHIMRAGSKNFGDAARMAEIFDGIATRHSNGLPGMQQLALHALFGSSTKPKKVLPFMRIGATHFGTTLGGGMATENVTPAGQTAQGMRLTEQIVQSTSSKDKVLFDMMAGQIRDLRADNARLGEECRELFIALRQELITTVKLGHEQKMQAMRFVRESMERRRIFQMLPALANVMANREVFPLSAEDTSIIESMSETLNVDEARMLAQWVGKTNPNLSGVIMARFEKAQRTRIEEDLETARVAHEVIGIDAETDAAGDPAKRLQAAAEGTLGASNAVAPSSAAEVVHPTAGPGAISDDGALIESLFGTVSDAEVAMLTGAIAMKNSALADKMRARYKAFKATRAS